MYYNYHKHDHFGNPWSLDVVVKPEEYCKRAVELGHTAVFTTNHGVQGNIFEWIDCAKKYGLKVIYGTEAYFVHNRKESDRSNNHLIIIAKNNDGVMQLNDIMTEAHDSGFYYRPRIDDELLFSLNPENFIITTACVAGVWRDRELMLKCKMYFGENFFIEVQNHNIDIQKELNREMLEFSKAAGIELIHANDSHYIYPKDSKYRDIFLKGKERYYENEDDMILDYPDEDAIFDRYRKQGIFTNEQVRRFLDNTHVFKQCEPLTIINDDIKLPPISDHPNDELREIIYSNWQKESKNIPEELYNKYKEAIEYELDIIEKTNMANYFLIDYNVVKNGIEKYNGVLTKTGRGSAPSFYVTKLLGLTDIDRISAPITLFPTRFMSVERILGTRSLPDIDLNTSDREPFIKATEDLLGKDNCAWMLAWKPLQDASAFRVYCKGIGMHISEYDEIAKNLEDYEEDPRWKKKIQESKRFVGVVESISESPCSMLLYYRSVRKELGLVRTSRNKMCCLLDGYNCDKYKYLKNDYLTVQIWAIIRDTCHLASIEIPTIRQLDKLLDDDTFEIYEKGITCTINQADSDFATSIATTYKPKSVSEMSAFVAIIRPGCASLLQDFIDRKPYTTGVAELDEQLIEGNHRMIYQELIMKYLIWLGIPETGSYDIIKKIAKKKFKEAELEDLKSKLLNGWIKQVGKEDGFIETWTVVEQAARYSFNASHSLSYAYDSLYGAYLKSHYPLEYYTVVLNYYSDDAVRTTKLINELKNFGITLKPIKFRYSRSEYSLFREENSIYKGIVSIKYINAIVADQMYEMKDNQYDDFIDLLYDLKENTSIDTRQLKILIDLEFFSEFGNSNHLKKQFELFELFNNKKQIKKDKLSEMKIPEEYVRQYAGKETEKLFSKIDMNGFLKNVCQKIRYKPTRLSEKIGRQIEHLGYIDIKDARYSGYAAVMDVDTKYAPRIKLYSLKNGITIDCKVDRRTFNMNKIKVGDILYVSKQEKKPKVRKSENGEWENVPGTSELWIREYKMIDL